MVTIAIPTKKCFDCMEDLPVGEFTKDQAKEDGLDIRCKECKRKHAREYRATAVGRRVHRKANRKYLATDHGREIWRQQAIRYRGRHPERVLQQQKKSRGKDCVKAVQRRWFFKRAYNSSPEEYDIMFKDQEGRCKICDTPRVELNRRIGANHDPVTGDTRGLLCPGCTINLARFENGYLYGTEWTERFEEYLREHNEQPIGV